jgi:hypothetical protein
MSDAETKKKVVKYKKYQQGDVVMLKVDDDYFKEHSHSIGDQYKVVQYNTQSHNNPILALGEVTGHKHQIHMKDMLDKAEVTLHMGYNRKAGEDVPQSFEVREETVTLTHEEHAPLDLPPGKVNIVQEFNHITRRAQNVAD